MGDLERLAYSIVNKAFEDKVDKAGKPYIKHLLRVSANINPVHNIYEPECLIREKFKYDPHILKTVALLHDLIEDCEDWTLVKLKCYEFPVAVIEAVSVLTHDDNETYGEYIAKIAKNPIARLVKIYDLKDNMDVSRLNEINITGLKKYHESYLKLINTIIEEQEIVKIDEVQIVTKIKNCKECPHLKEVKNYTSDSFENSFKPSLRWVCGNTTEFKTIQHCVKSSKEEKEVEIPNWCPLRKS